MQDAVHILAVGLTVRFPQATSNYSLNKEIIQDYPKPRDRKPENFQASRLFAQKLSRQQLATTHPAPPISLFDHI